MITRPIAITTGDHRGIGPEVISKGLNKLRRTLKPHEVIIFGKPDLYKPFKKLLPYKVYVWREEDVFSPRWNGPQKNALNFINISIPASIKHKDAYSCGRYIELATNGALRGTFSALTTGPIDKNELQKGGYHFDGHTEMLQTLCKAKSVTMMMASPGMRTVLVTTHEPLSKVSKALSREKIIACFENTFQGLKFLFGIPKPRLAVLGLNPHASDQGLFGSEEHRIIQPAIRRMRSLNKTLSLQGPFPPDGFFAQWKNRHSKAFDAIVCMYHDQGLIPVKLWDFKNTVNVTLGLPIIRTSVDHGVGYDIAGKNRADASSFCAALKLARLFVKNKKKS